VQQKSESGMTYWIRSSRKPAALVPSLRAAIEKIDPELSLAEIRTRQQKIAETMRTEFTIAALTAGFGVLALALASVGIYGIVAYSVANRRNEIGIRLALGAEPGQVRGMLLRESTWLAVTGISVGVAAALGLVRLVKSMLYGIQSNDPLTIAGGVLILLAGALVASWIPARHAAGVQPVEELRHEKEPYLQL
jgi:ABC-type antimicrobial peptide transport system permease subunit